MYKIVESTHIVKRSITAHRRNIIKSFIYKVLKIQIWIVLMQSHKKYKASSQGVCDSGTVNRVKSFRSRIVLSISTSGQKIEPEGFNIASWKCLVYSKEILYTHQENQAQHIPVLKCSQDSEFHRRKIIIIVKIIVLIITLAKTSLNTCDASTVLYFYKIKCGILLHFPKLYDISHGLSVLIQLQMRMCTHSEILPRNIAYRYFQVSMFE